MPMLGVKGLLLRVAIAAVASLGFSVVVGLWISKSTETALRSERVDRLLTAIEMGPLQMARLQSNEIAVSQLKELMKASNKPEPLFLSATIVSGPNKDDVSAKWEQDISNIAEQCLSKVTSEKSFSDAVFPYQVNLLFDNCVTFSGIARLKIVFVILNISTAFLVLVTVWFGTIPVTRSIQRAMDLLNRGNSIVRSQLPFAPLEELLATAERVVKAEKHAALAHVTQQVIHDLKTPLVAFEQIAFVKNWVAFEHEKPSLQNSLVRIHAMVEALKRNELELLIFTSRCEFSLVNLTSELVPYASERGVQLEAKNRTSIFLDLDLSKFERAIMNLIRNAIESGAKNVTTDFEMTLSDVCFKICDDGPGVPSELEPLLFERGVSFGKAGGTGLGLSYSKSIVQGHGGELEYKRSATKTTFTFTLKREASVQEDYTTDASEQSSSGKSQKKLREFELLIHLSALNESQNLVSELRDLGCQAGIYAEHNQNDFEVVYIEPGLVTDKILAVGSRVVIARKNEDPKNAALRLLRTLQILNSGKIDEKK
jgi:signal transduction histidine kinase